MQFSLLTGCTHHHLFHQLAIILLLSINSKKYIDNKYFKIPHLHVGLPTSKSYIGNDMNLFIKHIQAMKTTEWWLGYLQQ
jgi:hypothetical protein